MAGVPAMNASGLSGVDFGQRLSLSEQEQFNASPDLYDKSINSQYLEVYMYYAARERAREAADTRPIPDSTFTVMFKTITGRRSKIIYGNEQEPPPSIDESAMESASASDTEAKTEKPRVGSLSRDNGEPIMVSQDERDRLYRALRVASWQAVFYLITTDILGWSAASKTFQDMGYGAAVLTYFFFYLLAIFAGQTIWKLYLSMDSSRYPVVCYADLGERTFGRTVRHIFNIFQSLQLVFNVALLINGNAVTLAVLAKWNKHTCFMGLCAAWFGVGFLGGQIRSLKNFAWLCNWNIWINIATMIMTIYGCSKYAPLPSQSYHKNLDQPKFSTGWLPPYVINNWFYQVQGVQLAVFAYGGAMIFPEFMAEMRRPRDFWKAAACAQFFCFACYMTFGLVTYSFQGQYASILPTLDFNNYPLIVGTNTLSLYSTIVAAVLYGNIGCKVFYENVLRAYFKVPSMLSKKGRFIFSATVFFYWAIAWVIAVGIPALSALVTLVGSLFILQFTYTFPPILACGFWMQIDAMKADRPWEPGMIPGSNRVDTWKDKSRWTRGFKRYWYVKTFLLLLFVGALANCALGVYAGVKSAQGTYAKGSAAAGGAGAFGCKAPSYPWAPGHQDGQPNPFFAGASNPSG